MYSGIDQLGDAFKFKYNNDHLLMQKAHIPFIGTGHLLGEKGIAFLKAGYGFVKGSNYTEIKNKIVYSYPRKIRAIKLDLELWYFALNTNLFSFALIGEIGFNRMIEDVEIIGRNSYNSLGYGYGIGISYNKASAIQGLVFPFKYYKIGNNRFYTFAIYIPITKLKF
jgi:hypothetical protein